VSTVQFASDGDGGLGVAVPAVDHQLPVERGQLWVEAAGDVAGLVERQPEHGRAFLADRPARLVHGARRPGRGSQPDVGGGLLGGAEAGAVGEEGPQRGGGDPADAGQ
jgi:hypothetical protein